MRLLFTVSVMLTFPVAVAAPGALACDLPPPAVRDLDVQRFYADRAGSAVDPVLKALHVRGTAPVRDWLSHAVKDADSSLRQSTPSLRSYKARCALEWLERWASEGALTGTLTSKQAEAERRWTLAGAALAYLKVRPHASSEQRRVIGRWLKVLALRSSAAFKSSGAKPNNHLSWLGLGLAATALATDDAALWQQARRIFRTGAESVGLDGTLPLEVARGARALHYHVFAAMPLVTLASLAAWRGEDWTADGGGGLQRLVLQTRAGLADPQLFDQLAGVRQERPVNPGAGWLQLAAGLFPGEHALPDPETPAGHRWLGGNVLLLRQALTGGAPK